MVRRRSLARLCFPNGLRLASASWEVWIWEASTGQAIYQLEPSQGFYQAVWSPDSLSRWLAAGSSQGVVVVWDAATGKRVATLEGHTNHVRSVAFSPDGQLLASAASDGVRLWSCGHQDWRLVSTIPVDRPRAAKQSRELSDYDVVAFHPLRPWLATSGSTNSEVRIWRLALPVLVNKRVSKAISYTSAKIVVVGDSGVGKTGLGWRLAHGEFKEQASTHGQQFWLLGRLGKTRSDGTQCEAILWDLAGQPDYRLIHALFLDDADLALILFDPSRNDEPLRGVEFWLKQLRVTPAFAKLNAPGDRAGKEGPYPAILVAARSDRGTARITAEELEAFCRQRGIRAYASTSALRGEGIEELIHHMQESIP